jgi:hypothetical protein
MKLSRAIAGAMLLLFAGTAAFAQRSTEMYIPIGQSPGISGKQTAIGTISDVRQQERLITCALASGTLSAKITSKTRVWIDRSKAKLANTYGTFADCTKGRKVEVKYVNNDKRDGGEADWVKVEVVNP